MPLCKIGTTADLAPGKSKRVMANGIPIALFNVDGAFFAIHDVCSHRGNALHDGELEGTIVTCPLHGAQFDVTTGKNVSPPAPTPVKRFPITRQGNDLFVEL